jgi:hypothetical protein
MSGEIQSHHSNFNQQQREGSHSNQQQREGSKLASWLETRPKPLALLLVHTRPGVATPVCPLATPRAGWVAGMSTGCVEISTFEGGAFWGAATAIAPGSPLFPVPRFIPPDPNGPQLPNELTATER